MPSKPPDLAETIARELTSCISPDPALAVPLAREIRRAMKETRYPKLVQDAAELLVPFSVDGEKIALQFRQLLKNYLGWMKQREAKPRAFRAKTPPARVVYGGNRLHNPGKAAQIVTR